ncbi:hypothetical protein LTR62_002922 [Meristemomyces frigidus]|uniref:Uncharacterized protein n=1 Tax=Meristemomyces frigidus TaxID=1508187 RepID=A0AAN7TRR9_9PEZI|nr:hypothetical protein LTR62_002922 [Meristemomyces frigidus]
MQFIKVSMIAIGVIIPSISNMMVAASDKVTFRRFATAGCDSNRIIHNDVHLNSGKCKSFDHDEPPFESFQIVPRQDFRVESANWASVCRMVAFSDFHCKGDAISGPGMDSSMGQCVTLAGGNAAHSVFFNCTPPAPAPPPETTASYAGNGWFGSSSASMSHYTVIPAVIASDMPTSTATVLTTLPLSTMTVTPTAAAAASAKPVVKPVIVMEDPDHCLGCEL